MLNLAQGFVERGFAVDVVTAQASGPYLNQVPRGARLVDLASSRVLTALPGLVRYLRTARPKTLIAAMGHTNIVALCARFLARRSTRIVVTAHLNTSVCEQHKQPLRARLVRPLEKLFYLWADEIVAVSEGVADDMVRSGVVPSRDRIRVIYNPVISPDLHEKAKAAVDHPWFAAGEPPVFLNVGRLTAQKDQATLLKGFASLRKRHRARLLILGEGELRSELEGLIAELGIGEDVSLPGFCENPYAFMSRTTGFVLSSGWEGLPTVLIEAASLGVPVISTDCPSGPREILKEGALGTLVPVGDSEALATAMEKLLEQQEVSSFDRAHLDETFRPFHHETAVDAYLQACLEPRTPIKVFGPARRAPV